MSAWKPGRANHSNVRRGSSGKRLGGGLGVLSPDVGRSPPPQGVGRVHLPHSQPDRAETERRDGVHERRGSQGGGRQAWCLDVALDCALAFEVRHAAVPLDPSGVAAVERVPQRGLAVEVAPSEFDALCGRGPLARALAGSRTSARQRLGPASTARMVAPPWLPVAPVARGTGSDVGNAPGAAPCVQHLGARRLQNRTVGSIASAYPWGRSCPSPPRR